MLSLLACKDRFELTSIKRGVLMTEIAVHKKKILVAFLVEMGNHIIE